MTARRSDAVVEGLAVRRWAPSGDRDGGPTVVLVHGAMDRAASFSRVVRRLERHDVVAYDRRGYGDSRGSGIAESVASHSDDLLAVLEWTGSARHAVVGHSLGGTIALLASQDGSHRSVAPQRVGAFESPVPSLDGSYDEIGGGAVQVGHDRGPEAAGEHFYRLMIGDRTWERLRPGDRAARRSEGAALLAELIDLRRPVQVLEPDLVGVPVVVGRAGLSAERMRSAAALLRDRLGDASMFEIPLAGHGAHLTHPGEFARFVQAVMGVSPAAGTDSLR